MRLSCKPLKNVDSVNAWEYTEVWTIGQNGDVGQAASLYAQIIDLDRDDIRFMPQGTVVTFKATFPNLDSAFQFDVTGSQPFADDKSIWKFDILQTQLPSGGAVFFELTIDGVVKAWSVSNFLDIDLVNAGAC